MPHIMLQRLDTGTFSRREIRLAEAQREAERVSQFATNIRFGLVIDIITAQLGLIRTLRGLTATFGAFNDEQLRRAAVRASLGK